MCEGVFVLIACSFCEGRTRKIWLYIQLNFHSAHYQYIEDNNLATESRQNQEIQEKTTRETKSLSVSNTDSGKGQESSAIVEISSIPNFQRKHCEEEKKISHWNGRDQNNNSGHSETQSHVESGKSM